jgi:hypothetical protein
MERVTSIASRMVRSGSSGSSMVSTPYYLLPKHTTAQHTQSDRSGLSRLSCLRHRLSEGILGGTGAMSFYLCTVPKTVCDIPHTRQAISDTKLNPHDLDRPSCRKRVPEARAEGKHKRVLLAPLPSITQTDIEMKYVILRLRLGGQIRSNNPFAGFHGTHCS